MQTLLDQVHEQYRAGLYLQAFEASRALGPPDTWPGAQGRIMACRLVSRLGGMRLSDALLWRAWREFPSDWQVRYFRSCHLSHRRGPLEAIQFLESFPDLGSAPQQLQGEWIAAAARQYALLRDFETAHADIVHALRFAPKHAWLWIERAHVLEQMDRREEALEAVDEALRLRPWYDSAVEKKADLLAEMNREAEALDLLLEAVQTLESGYTVWQAALMLGEFRRYREARDLFERCVTLFPLSDKRHRWWLDARRSDAAYRCGDFARAYELATRVRGGFYKRLVENIDRAPPDPRRVELDVPFVRQHFATCSPATLTSLCGYWNVVADHVELAEKICYDGTPNHSERHWAEERGLVVREFTLTWDAAVALLDREIPLAVETRSATFAHIQPIVGYDARRGTFLTRDPGERIATEMLADPLLEDMAAFGPRAMTVVPAEFASRLDGLDLPDARLFDEFYAMQRALLGHDRPAAAAALDRLTHEAADHWLALHARRTLANYDGDHVAVLACIDRQCAKFPDNSALQVSRLGTLATLGRHAERLKSLEELCATTDCAAVFWRDYGRELSQDFRRLREARDWLRRALRYLRSDALAYYALAGVEWDLGFRDESMRLYRIAACLDDKDEQHARSYFIASRHLKRVNESLAWLRRRFANYGHKSSGPGATLANALFDLDRDGEALDVLHEAVARRGNDGWLLTLAATKNAVAERWASADDLLERARPIAHRGSWLFAAARMAELRGDMNGALERWRELAELDPIDATTHETICRLLWTTADERRAREHIRAVAAAHPHHLGIQQALLKELRLGDVDEAIAAARRCLELHPGDAWTRRELVDALQRKGLVDEALAEADTAVAIDATTPASYGFRGKLLAGLGRVEEARRDFRRALELSADYEYAFDALMDLCGNDAQRREALAWFRGELTRQTTFGDGILSYYGHAKDVLEEDELLPALREAKAARPDLWQTWCALSTYLRRLERVDEARQVAEEAARRFPLTPRTWFDLALLYAKPEELPERIEALKKALEMSPGWGAVANELAEALEQNGEAVQAELTLRDALRRSPNDAYVRGTLADLLYRIGQTEDALLEVKRACRGLPGYDWGWRTAREWFGNLGRSAELLTVARETVESRPNDAVAWLRLAECIDLHFSKGEFDAEEARTEMLAALDRATSLDPTYVDAHAERACVLFEAGRLDEALSAARPVAFPAETRPTWLRAWEARILGKQGESAGAIECYRSVFDDAPHYTWAWGDYLRLLDSNEWHDACRAAAEKAVASNPDYEVGWGYLGDACWELGDLVAARRAFDMSLAASSTYVYGASQLVRLYMHTREYAEAAKALAELRRRDSGSYPLDLAIRLDVARHGRRAKLDDLTALAKLNDAEDQRFRDIATFLRNGFARWTAERILRPLVEDGAANYHVGTAWTILSGARWTTMLRLMRMTGRAAAWQHAAQQFAKELVAARARWKLFWTLMFYGPRLREDVDTWGLFGYALMKFDRQRACWKWMRDWLERPGARPWALLNAAMAAWRMKRYDDFRQIGEAALAQPADHSHNLHLIWRAAAVLVLDREPARAAELLAQTKRSQDAYWNAAVFEVVEASVAVLNQPPPADPRAVRTLLRAVQTAVAKHRRTVNRDPDVREIAYRCLELAAQHLGRTWRAKWYRMRRRW